jgi:hypothetical protein
MKKKAKTELEQLREDLASLKREFEELKTATKVVQKKTRPWESDSWDEIKRQRIRFNEAIMGGIGKYLAKHPEIRFGQALVNLKLVQVDTHGAKDPFYEEPYDAYMRYLSTQPNHYVDYDHDER